MSSKILVIEETYENKRKKKTIILSILNEIFQHNFSILETETLAIITDLKHNSKKNIEKIKIVKCTPKKLQVTQSMAIHEKEATLQN